MRYIVVLFILITFCIGCGDKIIDTSTDEKLKKSIESVKNSLSSQKKEEFEKAISAFASLGLENWGQLASDPEGLQRQFKDKIHGKTADEIISQGNIIIAEQIKNKDKLFGTHRERPIHYRFIEIYVNEEKEVDINFSPNGEKEKFLKPFVVLDYTEISIDLTSLELNSDFFIVERNNLGDPPIPKGITIITKEKIGQAKITFFIKEGELKRKIGILNIDVIKRPVPDR